VSLAILTGRIPVLRQSSPVAACALLVEAGQVTTDQRDEMVSCSISSFAFAILMSHGSAGLGVGRIGRRVIGR
jgi:hypothetical protein